MSAAGAALMTEDEMREKVANEIGSYLYVGCDPVETALRIAIPWAREQALREAAVVVRRSGDGKEALWDPWEAAFRNAREETATAIEALIPARPSQETTDE